MVSRPPAGSREGRWSPPGPCPACAPAPAHPGVALSGEHQLACPLAQPGLWRWEGPWPAGSGGAALEPSLAALSQAGEHWVLGEHWGVGSAGLQEPGPLVSRLPPARLAGCPPTSRAGGLVGTPPAGTTPAGTPPAGSQPGLSAAGPPLFQPLFPGKRRPTPPWALMAALKVGAGAESELPASKQLRTQLGRAGGRAGGRLATKGHCEAPAEGTIQLSRAGLAC